jgi:hypothetical protein
MWLLVLPGVVRAQGDQAGTPTPIPPEADRRQVIPFLQGTYGF